MSRSPLTQKPASLSPARRVAALLALLSPLLLAVPSPGLAATPTILVIGDSQAGGLAGALQRLYLHDTRYHIADRTKIGTGINTRVTYDWEAAAQKLSQERADIAIVMFGANDRPAVRVRGQVDPERSRIFSEVYSARIHAILKSLRDAKMDVIWVGHPIVRDPVYAEDMAFLDRLYQDAALTDGAQWFPTWSLVADNTGGYAAYGFGSDGLRHRLRADDGIHFTEAGYDLIANLLSPIIDRLEVAREGAGRAANPPVTTTASAKGPS